MPSILDGRMDATLAALTGPGGPLAVATVAVDGLELPVITGVPQTLPPYFAHYCSEHADKTFLVAGAERLTFAQVHHAALCVAQALVASYRIRPGDRVGIAMRKGQDDLRGRINAALAEKRADGAYKALNDKYFPIDVYTLK